MTSDALVSPIRGSAPAVTLAHWILRLGAAFCFIGHGAFGLITKAAWLPYFAVVGIPESVAWRLMPLVGTVDVVAAIAVLLLPMRLPLLYMVAWGAWTALLRPLAGESFFETIERAGNYGAPLALLLLAEPFTFGLFERLTLPLGAPRRVGFVLKWTTVLLLLGHGVLGALEKPMLTAQYASIRLPASTTALVGFFEILLALAIAVRPRVPLLLFACGWKLGTEWLFIAAGDPIWEFVERAGSYATPLALAVLLWNGRDARAPAGRLPMEPASVTPASPEVDPRT